ncbi:MAG TPA: quinone-dependent dihydroorotate dehydrogenase [Candidatus Paceibacterota bacterium]|nr:quinone-dependent dihydroorotate dehydrogenase [Candidatus Paceibacterota bacterium]
MINKAVGILYRNLIKPILFQLDAEFVHNMITQIGEGLENQKWLLDFLLSRGKKTIKKNILGLEFENPVGLAAGFDYNGHLAKVMKHIGFGFNTVGTVTAQKYEGNKPPRLARLPQSKSLLVNKGFKSDGAEAIAGRLDEKKIEGHLIGISVGSSNVPNVNTINKAVDDYLETFRIFKDKPYVKYFELNISCPNAAMAESFSNPRNFKELVQAVASCGITQPIFVKMPNEIDFDESDTLVRSALENGICGFIFSNLVKDRNNQTFNKKEIARFKNVNGNFSGKPTAKNSERLIKHTRDVFGNSVVIVGCGGIFSADDARERLNAGADLVQLITGMIYEGPQLIGEINGGINQ